MLKCWRLCTGLHGVTAEKSVIWRCIEITLLRCITVLCFCYFMYLYLLCNEPALFQEPHLAHCWSVCEMCTSLWETWRTHVWSDGVESMHNGPQSLCPTFSVKIEVFTSDCSGLGELKVISACLTCMFWMNIKVWEAFYQTNWSFHRSIDGNVNLGWL